MTEEINSICMVIMTLCSLTATATFWHDLFVKRGKEPNAMQRCVNKMRIDAGLDPVLEACTPKKWYKCIWRSKYNK